MTHDFLLWIALSAYAIHILEEFSFDWKKWANSSLGLKDLEWCHFCLANATVMFIGISAAMVGWKLPAFGLIIVALMYINGIFFHILPTIVQRKFSPGVITSTLLFIPISTWVYYGAYIYGVLSLSNLLLSLILGALLMASPILFIKLNTKFNKS